MTVSRNGLAFLIVAALLTTLYLWSARQVHERQENRLPPATPCSGPCPVLPNWGPG